MKILALVINHGTNQTAYCQNLVDTFNDMRGYDFTVKVFSSELSGIRGCEEILISDYKMADFGFGVHDWIDKNDISGWDYVLLTENDFIFSRSNFDTFFKYKQPDSTIGFLLYENLNGSRYLVNHGFGNSKLSFKSGKGVAEVVGNLIRLDSPHQGCCFFSSEEIKRLVRNPPPISQIRYIYGAPAKDLENKVSGFFYSDSFPGSKEGVKVYIPIWEFEKLLVYHQPNKYVYEYKDLPSVETLIKERGLRNE